MNATSRVAVVVSHPIQHFCPMYASWAKLPGIEVEVFFASDHGLRDYKDDGFGRTVRWEGINLEFAHKFLPGSQGRRVANDLDSADLPERLSAFSPHALVVYGYTQRLQRRALRWGKASTTPVLMISDSELRAHRSLVRRAAKALVLPLYMRGVDLFLTVGDANEDYYRAYGVGAERMVRSPFPIDVVSYDKALPARKERRRGLRAKLRIPEHHAVLVMVGKLIARKRQVDLVEFSNSLQGRRDDVTVVLVGSGADEAALRRATRREGPGGVIFAGFVPPTELPDYYCGSDVYMHCAAQEPHSLAISEAIYCGLPAIVSDRCGSYGPTDDVRPGINGDVYPCGDVQRLAASITELLSDRERCSGMGARSREIARGSQERAHGAGLRQALDVLAAKRR